MAQPQPSAREIFEACKILFGPSVQVTPQFLRVLQPVGLKTAFRKRALETHPDRAKALGLFEQELLARFQKVRQAYDILDAFLKSSSKRPDFTTFSSFANRTRPSTHHRQSTRRPPSSHTHTAKRRNHGSDHFYQGTLPRRCMMFGQYLYYSGIISWRTLIDAITWQRMQRPRIGQIAMGWGLLTSRDVLKILRERRLNERFGECAHRLGYISSFQHIALVGRQRKLQRPIGEFFIMSGHLSGGQLLHLLNRHRMHNRAVLFGK
ncbi:MAG: hypothetical protein N3B18_13915 [Desulfobacterota bacterium]|nr:hypothetical protein [Thermodesulfobacteriota bacterium]